MAEEKDEKGVLYGFLGWLAFAIALFVLNPNESDLAWGFATNKVKQSGVFSTMEFGLIANSGLVNLKYNNYYLFSTLTMINIDGSENTIAYGALGFVTNDFSQFTFANGKGIQPGATAPETVKQVEIPDYLKKEWDQAPSVQSDSTPVVTDTQATQPETTQTAQADTAAVAPQSQDSSTTQ